MKYDMIGIVLILIVLIGIIVAIIKLQKFCLIFLSFLSCQQACLVINFLNKFLIHFFINDFLILVLHFALRLIRKNIFLSGN